MTALKERATIIDALGTSLSYGGQALSAVPELLRRVLEEEAWREFVTKLGEHVTHERFPDFVTAPPLAGLGATVDLLRRVVANDPITLDLLDQAIQNPIGANQHRNNVPTQPAGNSAAKALRRLRKDRPDLHAQVLAGELSAHRAMVTAGFRRPTFTVPADSPERIAQTLRRHLEPEMLRKLRALLDGQP